MAPLQIILLLMLVRLPGILAVMQTGPETPGGPGSPSPVSSPILPFPPHAWLAVASLLLTHLLLVGVVFRKAHVGARELHLPSTSAPIVTGGMDRLMGIARWSTLILTAAHLWLLPVPAVIHAALSRTVFLKQIPLLAEVLLLTPALISWVCFWAANYQVENAVRDRSLAYRLASGLPVHPMPQLSRYLSMQMRHNFYMMLPLGIASLIEDIAGRLDPWFPYATTIASPLAFVAVMLTVPWLVTKIWMTVPLHGPLRTKLDSIAGEYRLRFRNILIWKTHNAISNAAILGYIPFSRYFLMTDALLETLTDQQIEAVFGHEVGHGVHRHILWYMASLFGAIFVSGSLAYWTQYELLTNYPTLLPPWVTAGDTVSFLLSLGMFAVFAIFGFSFISHRFEHQADWFASKHMSRELMRHPVPVPAVLMTVADNPDEPLMLEEMIPTEVPVIPEAVRDELAMETELQAEPSPPLAPFGFSAAGGGPASPPPLPPISQAGLVKGAECFISALDMIIELAHRSRSRKGWMHPSVDQRMELLRKISRDPNEAKWFDEKMIWIRVGIAAMLIGGGAAFWYSVKLPDPRVLHDRMNQPDPTGKLMII